MSVLEIILIVIAALLLLRAVTFLIERSRLLISVLGLSSIDGVTVRIDFGIAFFLPWVTRRTAATVTVGAKRYAIRLFNGRSSMHAVHIASPEYAAVYIKGDGDTGLGNQLSYSSSGVHIPRCVYMPPRIIREGDIPVTVLCPAPSELTYVTEAKTSVRIALTGDLVGAERIFTRRTLERFIDRDSRGFYDK